MRFGCTDLISLLLYKIGCEYFIFLLLPDIRCAYLIFFAPLFFDLADLNHAGLACERLWQSAVQPDLCLTPYLLNAVLFKGMLNWCAHILLQHGCSFWLLLPSILRNCFSVRGHAMLRRILALAREPSFCAKSRCMSAFARKHSFLISSFFCLCLCFIRAGVCRIDLRISAGARAALHDLNRCGKGDSMDTALDRSWERCSVGIDPGC